MKPSNDYPRMLFHPRERPVTVNSREEELALGGEWRRTIHQPAPEPPPTPRATGTRFSAGTGARTGTRSRARPHRNQAGRPTRWKRYTAPCAPAPKRHTEDAGEAAAWGSQEEEVNMA